MEITLEVPDRLNASNCIMSYVSKVLRQFVIQRAKRRCEYCLFLQHIALFTFEMEHVIAQKHGGKTVPENLALACPYCNCAIHSPGTSDCNYLTIQQLGTFTRKAKINRSGSISL